MNHERVLAAMDKNITQAERDISRAQARLGQLTSARAQYAAACGLAKRGRDEGAATLRLLLGVMKDGGDWRVADIVAALKKEGTRLSCTSVSAKLAGETTTIGPFQRVSRGVYRLKPEIIARWAKTAA
jgi:lambda repressor-like predicted transcriptional regulator